MEISELKPSERVVEILHPGTDEPIGVRVSLVSMDDERVKRVKRRLLDERLRLESRGKHFKADDIEDNHMALIFAIMTGWEWYGSDLTLDGQKNPVFNQRNVYSVLKTCPFFITQIDKEVEDEKAFFQV